MKIYLVIPTIRSLSFLQEWGDKLNACHLMIIEDHKTKEVSAPRGSFQSVTHFTWNDIKNDLGKDEWIFSRQNAGIRSYGFWKAYQRGADIVITLDDDCYPVDADFVEQHVKNLALRAPARWVNTFPSRDFIFTRGIPYDVREKYRVVVSHGLWTNQIDLDAQTQLKHPRINLPPYPSLVQFVAPGVYFPMCSMNLAFHRDVVPLMYFPLMGKKPDGDKWSFDRFDDIWSGIFAKKILDHLNLAVVNGSPFVEHRKASDAYKNLEKERSGLKINETLWKAVDAVSLTKDTPSACYRELAEKAVFPKTEYFKKLKRAMIIWSELF